MTFLYYFVLYNIKTFYRGKKVFQIKAYNNCYQKNINNFSWFLFVDVDEFLYLKKPVSLQDYLADTKFQNCDNIFFNYKEIGDSDLLDYDERPITKRFTKNFRYTHSMKFIVKGGIKDAKMNIHRPYNIERYCNSNGQNIIPKSFLTPKITVETAEIRHYLTKSIGEFFKKIKRGWPSTELGSKSYHKFMNFRIKTFFELNKIIKAKYNKVCQFSFLILKY